MFGTLYDISPLLFCVVLIAVITGATTALFCIIYYTYKALKKYNRWKSTREKCDALISFNLFLVSYCKNQDNWHLFDNYVRRYKEETGRQYPQCIEVSFQTYKDLLKYKRFCKILDKKEEEKEKSEKEKRKIEKTAELLSEIAKEYECETIMIPLHSTCK